MLKILGGQARGRPLRSPLNDPRVRPMLGRIKKSMFDILRPRLTNSHFLDMYAGTGAVGLEAISRGAKSAVFIESSPDCIGMIQENIAKLGMTNSGTAFRLDSLGDLSYLPKPFDIIFMGPPYKDAAKAPLALVTPTLENITQYDLLAPHGIIIAQHHDKEIVNSTPEWDLFRQEEYGDSMLSFFRKRT